MITTIIQPDTWWTLDPDQRKTLREWMRENHLEADDIPTQEPVTCDETTIYYTVVLRNAEGKPRIEEDGQGEPMVVCEERTTPLLTKPPLSA